jgi:hypothetical protein
VLLIDVVTLATKSAYRIDFLPDTLYQSTIRALLARADNWDGLASACRFCAAAAAAVAVTVVEACLLRIFSLLHAPIVNVLTADVSSEASAPLSPNQRSMQRLVIAFFNAIRVLLELPQFALPNEIGLFWHVRAALSECACVCVFRYLAITTYCAGYGLCPRCRRCAICRC